MKIKLLGKEYVLNPCEHPILGDIGDWDCSIRIFDKKYPYLRLEVNDHGSNKMFDAKATVWRSPSRAVVVGSSGTWDSLKKCIREIESSIADLILICNQMKFGDSK